MGTWDAQQTVARSADLTNILFKLIILHTEDRIASNGCAPAATLDRMSLTVADQKRWFKVWTSILDNPDFQEMDLQDIGRWVLLGASTALNGDEGRLKVPGSGKHLIHLLRVSTLEEAFAAINRLGNLTIEEGTNGTPTAIVTWRNWNKYQVDSTYVQRQKMSRSKRRREEKRKEEKKNPPTPLDSLKPKKGPAKLPPDCEACTKILAHLNAKTGRKYGLVGDGAKNLHARHQAYGVDACLQVIDYKAEQWGNDPKMRDHVDLLTLFRPSNFDRYLNQSAPSLPLAGSRDYPKGDLE
jgi:uncharacterized phage protein (TIGR02220 family)